MVMQLVDLTQTTLSGLKLSCVQQKLKAPVLIQTSMGAAKYMGGYKVCKALIENLVESMGITVPVAIPPWPWSLRRCSWMYRSWLHFSHVWRFHTFQLKKTLNWRKDVVEKLMLRVSVEAEVGTIGGEEDGIIGDGELAPIEDAKAMVGNWNRLLGSRYR